MPSDLRKLERVTVAIWFQRDLTPPRWIAFCEEAQVTAWGFSRDEAVKSMCHELDAEEHDLDQYGPSNSQTKPLPGAELRLVTRLPSGKWSRKEKK